MKELVKEIPFGSKGAIAQIKVRGWMEGVSLDGDVVRQKLSTSSNVTVISAVGKTLGENSHAQTVVWTAQDHSVHDAAHLDPSKEYSRVDRTLVEGAESAKAVNETIEALRQELSAEFGQETDEQKAEKQAVENEIKEATAIVAQAEKQGVDTLITTAEVKAWRKRYNDLHNEGGEGYIPSKVSREQYEWALSVLGQPQVR